MTLEEAYEITGKMAMQDHRNPTDLQRDAKEVIYRQVIKKQFADKNGNVPPCCEPDFNEGWDYKNSRYCFND
jgi:hypothetical protein